MINDKFLKWLQYAQKLASSLHHDNKSGTISEVRMRASLVSGLMLGPWSAMNKAWHQGYAPVSSRFEFNFENGKGRVALISKAVASSFSYRTGEEKKKEKKV